MIFFLQVLGAAIGSSIRNAAADGVSVTRAIALLCLMFLIILLFTLLLFYLLSLSDDELVYYRKLPFLYAIN